jgi:short subunit dehydrogenase-like uncharacterized protein
MQAAAREYQVIVWGATGFTGRLACEHLARYGRSDLKWAIAGRSRARLEEAKQSVERLSGVSMKVRAGGDPDCCERIDAWRARIDARVGDIQPVPRLQHVPVVIADATDRASLAAMTQQTKVLLSLAGPYALVGTEVVAAAVGTGTHYCDM